MSSSAEGRQRSRHGQTGRHMWALAGLAVGLFIVALPAQWAGWAVRGERVRADRDLASMQLFEVRAELAWLHHGLLTESLVAEADGRELDETDVELFRRDRETILDQLERIATGSTEEAAVAESLLGEFADAPGEAWPFPAMALEDQHYAAVVAGPGGSPESDETGREDTLVTTMLPSLVLADGVSVALSQRPDGSPAWAADYIEATVDVVTNQPGWLGPDRMDPLAGHVLGPPPGEDEGARSAPVENLDADERADLALVWDYDQWLISASSSGFDSDPPMTIAALAHAATNVSDALRSATRAELEQEQASIVSSAPSDRIVMFWFGLSGVSGLAAIGAVVLLALWARARRRLLAEDAMTDHLTGARNRRYLDHVVAGRCRRVGYHHVVIMIDLDRFKLVNDTWGHDAGDALLTVMARRLDEAAQELTSPWEHASTAVVRAGGDEFVVALHCPDRVPLGAVTSRLGEIAGPVDLGLDEPANLEFSLGIAESDTPADLASMLKEADLAAYDNKRERAARRQPAPSDVEEANTLELR